LFNKEAAFIIFPGNKYIEGEASDDQANSLSLFPVGENFLDLPGIILVSGIASTSFELTAICYSPTLGNLTFMPSYDIYDSSPIIAISLKNLKNLVD